MLEFTIVINDLSMLKRVRLEMPVSLELNIPVTKTFSIQYYLYSNLSAKIDFAHVKRANVLRCAKILGGVDDARR